MRNWKAFFSKEDFPIELGDVRAQEIANHANALLLEALNQAEPVFGRGPYGLSWYGEGSIGALDIDSREKGRIVAIEELSDDEFDRHQDERERIGVGKFEPWFDKHGLMFALGESNPIVDSLMKERAKGLTKAPVREVNEGLRGGFRDGEVTFIAGSACLEDILSVLSLTAFQHGHKVLRIIDGAADRIYYDRDRYPRAIEIYKFARFDLETIEVDLPEFVNETGASFVVIDCLEIGAFFFKENRTADDFRKVMNAVKSAAQTSKAHIVLSSDTINLRPATFEELPIPVVDLSTNVIFFDTTVDDGQELLIEIKKCSHEINFGRFQSEFRCLKPSEWGSVLEARKYTEIED